MEYNFEWDSKKAKKNKSKHKVSFEDAVTVFKDPRAISIYDEIHSKKVDRWITLGLSSNKGVLVVIHTYSKVDKNTAVVRIISSRKATKNEKKQYMEP